MSRPRLDLAGRKFGRLLVTAYAGKDRSQNTLWLCMCECGTEATVRGSEMKRGTTSSCGCLKKEKQRSAVTKHGHYADRLHRIWYNMICRTTKRTSTSYPNYGGRGISVCPEWVESFDAFRSWALENGYQPKLSIDRVDNDANYSPDNCRWATAKEQASNRRLRKDSRMQKERPMPKSFKIAAAQGEVNIRKIDAMPDGLEPVSIENGVFVIGHSESGNTHVIDAGGVMVMERTKDVPAGLRMLYAIIEKPTELRQNSSTPHETIKLDPGIFSFRISREFDPFAEQARRVAD